MSDSPPSIKNSIYIAAGFILLIWAIKLAEVVFALDLHVFGVYPRHTQGLFGILSAPLVHGSWQHLMGNSAPLLLLGAALIFGYPKSRWWTLALVWLLSGAGVWLMGRESFHFGASGLTHGMFFFLLISGILRRDRRSAALLMLAFFMYSGMLMSIFPGKPGISFESHLFGALAGVICAVLFRHWDPKPEQKRYPWQKSPDDPSSYAEEEDPIIGDQWKLATEATTQPSHDESVITPR
ncbi:MAG: membrane associated rhomboid family serine protease [Halioglobus sp.]|jgi:membrane associated rhomboid family serine protease